MALVVAMERLLILGNTKSSLDSSSLKEYCIFLAELFQHSFVESAYPGAAVRDLQGEDNFRLVDQKEWCLPGGPTWCCPVRPKDWFEMFRLLLAVMLQVFEGMSLEPPVDLSIGPFGLGVALGVM